MIDRGRVNVLGVLVDAVDYPAAQERIIAAARQRRPYAVSALAVHGIMTGVDDIVHRHRLNALELVTPDGQPVRWAMNWLEGSRLPDRVYGPELMLRICVAAAAEHMPIYLYGSTPEVLAVLRAKLVERIPSLILAGSEPSKFDHLTPAEIDDLARRIKASGADMTFVGLGCPRQEVFGYELREAVSMPLIAVGAAFEYNAGLVSQPPKWAQDHGLQWAYRLAQDPGRLWRRYLILNPRFVLRLVAQKAHLWRPDPLRTQPPTTVVGYG